MQNPSTFYYRRSCGLMDKASDFYASSYPKIAGSSPAAINSISLNDLFISIQVTTNDGESCQMNNTTKNLSGTLNEYH